MSRPAARRGENNLNAPPARGEVRDARAADSSETHPLAHPSHCAQGVRSAAALGRVRNLRCKPLESQGAGAGHRTLPRACHHGNKSAPRCCDCRAAACSCYRC